MKVKRRKLKKGDIIIIKSAKQILEDYEKYNIPNTQRISKDDLWLIEYERGVITGKLTPDRIYYFVRWLDNSETGIEEIHPIEIW